MQKTSRRLAALILAALMCLGAAASAQEAGWTADFDFLQSLDAHVCAYLYSDQPALSRPVVHSEQNGDYLRRSIEGTSARGGTLAVDAACAADFSDPVTYVYGSRTGDLAPLDFLDADMLTWMTADSLTLTLLTPEGRYEMIPFAGLATRQNDAESWRVPSLPDRAALEEWLENLAQEGVYGPRAGDAWDKKWVALVTEASSPTSRRYVLYAYLEPLPDAGSDARDAVKAGLDGRETRTYTTDVGPWTDVVIYAQNDPLWSEMRYESEWVSVYRNFGGGGCGPTAAAMILANMVDAVSLPRMALYNANPLGCLFCPCSVNRLYCDGSHAPYRLQTAEEYLRYLPVAVANFATGNNRWNLLAREGSNYGSNLKFLAPLCSLFGLEVRSPDSLEEAVEALRDGNAMALGCTVRGDPFTNSSHFVVLAWADEEYLYILDPLRRDDYRATDKYGVLEVLSPGVVRVSLRRALGYTFSPLYLITSSR